MKLLTFILLFCCLTISASAQDPSLEGLPILNPDTLVIGADKDNTNPSKYISITVNGKERIAIGNGSAQRAFLDFTGDNELGFTELIHIRTNEAGAAGYGFTLAKYAGSNGETRQDNQFCWGYNVGPGGNRLVESEHLWATCIESRYGSSEGHKQLEMYDIFKPGSECSGSGCVDQRPRSITPNLSTGQIINRYSGLTIADDGLDRIRLSANQDFFGPTSQITFNGTRTSNDLMMAGGSSILSFKFNGANKVELFNTGIGNAEVCLFCGDGVASVNTLTFSGNIGSLSPNASGIRKNNNGKMQFSNGSGTWLNMAGGQCGAIPNSDGSNADNQRAVNALLGCLRTLGLAQ